VWEQIRSNRRRSACVIAVMGVLLVATGVALGTVFAPGREGMFGGGLVALAIWLVLWAVTASRGDDIMLRIAGAREIEKRDHPVLFNVVEEMVIAAQLGARPRIFIVDDPSPNAFAAGRDPSKASVAVTTGLLEILDRDELQGVVAHEIGHIANRDVALMTTMGIMLGAIVLLAELGLRGLWLGGGARRSRSSSRDGGAEGVLAVVAIALMILAPVFAQLIYFALSRRREYLADASGALFTRYPDGLASALEKLGAAGLPQADTSRVTRPMYIVRPLSEGERRRAASPFATHPPLGKRVRILRGMAGRADPAAYEQAFRAVTRRRVVGARTLAASRPVESQAPRPIAASERTTRRQRARQASDAFLSASGYQQHACGYCGATLKIPPRLRGKIRSCPRCEHPL
jgi:heat shock protein HtpX